MGRPARWRNALFDGAPREREPRESELLYQVKGYLSARGIWFVRINSGMAWIGKYPVSLAPKGTPDVLACFKGAFVAIETKRPKIGTVSPDQEKVHFAIRAAGGYVLVPRSIDELAEGLREIELRKRKNEGGGPEGVSSGPVQRDGQRDKGAQSRDGRANLRPDRESSYGGADSGLE